MAQPSRRKRDLNKLRKYWEKKHNKSLEKNNPGNQQPGSFDFFVCTNVKRGFYAFADKNYFSSLYNFCFLKILVVMPLLI